MNVEVARLTDFIDFKNGKSVMSITDGDVPVFGSNGIIGTTQEAMAENAVVLGRVGAFCGSVHMASGPFWPTDNTIIAKPKNDHPIRYLYYLLYNTPLREFAGGAAQPLITQQILSGITVRFHDVDQARNIVDFLAAYDDLIDNNRRRIALLDEAARLLYREWFVNLRFPGHEHVKFFDDIPEGWKRRTLVELAEVVMGQSPKSRFYNSTGDGLPFHQGVSDYGFRFVSHRTYTSVVTKIAEAEDILVSVRAPVGRINVTREKMVLGRGLAAVRSRTGRQSFLFYALKNHFYAENIIGTGAIYAATNKKELEGQVLVEPSEALLQEFEDRANAIDLQIACLTSQNDNLVRGRELLLPRLMNGEVAV